MTTPQLSPVLISRHPASQIRHSLTLLETVRTVLFLDECKVDSYKIATVNAWISHRIGKEKMLKVRTAGDELSAALSWLPPSNRPAVDAIAVGWGLSVTAAAKMGERSLCNLISTCYVLGQE